MDKQTFSEAVQRMERSLYRVAMSYTGNVPDAADAVQEALLRRRRRVLPMAQPPELRAAEPPGADVALYEALFSLPPKYRVPLILTCLDGYTMRETAHMLGVPEGTVKARLHRARLQLRERLGEEETDDA